MDHVDRENVVSLHAPMGHNIADKFSGCCSRPTGTPKWISQPQHRQLRPAGNPFDFLPFDYLSKRARNGQYHWGDITLRYRTTNGADWVHVDSSAIRKKLSSSTSAQGGLLATSRLGATLPASLPLNITREWIKVQGDLGLRFTLTNTEKAGIEIGSLGFPAEFNSIFTGRSAEQIQDKCSLTDPYIGMHGGYLRVTPVKGTGPVLLVTPLPGTDTPLEAWRNLYEASYSDTGYGSQTFEGYYEWQVLTNAWASKEWASVEPWNLPSSRMLQPGQSLTVGLRFSLAQGGVRDIDKSLLDLGIPVAVSVPGYVIPRDTPSQLSIRLPTGWSISSITSHPPAALDISNTGSNKNATSSRQLEITPSKIAFGRARLTVVYSSNNTQTIHYYITAPNAQTVSSLGSFLTTHQLFNDTSDPFYRGPSIITYDFETRKQVTQDPRVWIAGLSDEAEAGSFLPSAKEITILEEFIHTVLWGKIQRKSDYGVRKSIFYHDPVQVPEYQYDKEIFWENWWSWNKKDSLEQVNRAYNYVHVAAAYWALYRVGRAYPDLVSSSVVNGEEVGGWEWYLSQAYETAMKCVADAGVWYSREGLMGETVFSEILQDLKREGATDARGNSGWTGKANKFEEEMRRRAQGWDRQSVPFGSEMAWDSTGQEGVWYWSKYFGFNAAAAKTLNTVLGYDPTVAHWGWNGNARRYWDNVYGGKLQRIERQIHHYGSGLNALVLLSAFRASTAPAADMYLLRAGYGGLTGALSNINQEWFALASFHSWPDTLKWDGYSGDYGPNFVGLALGSATYMVQDVNGDFSGGFVAFGGSPVVWKGGVATVKPKDAFRRRVFVGPLKLLVTIDAGAIDSFGYNPVDDSLYFSVSQLNGEPAAVSAVFWLESTVGRDSFVVIQPPGLVQTRLGWKVQLNGTAPVTVIVRSA